MKERRLLGGWWWILLLFTGGLGFVALRYAFLIVPNERVMGPVQRILYFHVGSAIASYVAIAVLCFSSIAFLATQKWRWDALSEAAAEIACLLCSIVLITGMIWGHAAWNTVFNWEPRLVTFLILWLITIALNVLPWFASSTQIATQRSVLGILSAVTAPLVWYSIQLLPVSYQLHPVVIENRGLKHPDYGTALFLAVLTLCCFAIVLIALRRAIAIYERESGGRHGTGA